MPVAVVVRKRASDIREHVRANRLVEGRAKSSVLEHAELPRTAASVDAAIVGRGIRRPPEPRGDREVRGGDGNRGSCDAISVSREVSREADLPTHHPRARYRPLVFVSPEILLKSGPGESLHIVGQEGIANGEREPGSACNRAIRGLDAHDIRTWWSAR